MTKSCPRCKRILPVEWYYTRKETGKPYTPCKTCIIKWQREYYADNRDHIIKRMSKYAKRNRPRCNELSRQYNRKHRMLALQHYSNGKVECACCGEETLEFLALDHVNGGGGKHRRELGRGGAIFTRWLRTNKYPSGYQVLCHNCNAAKGYYGICPHNTAKLAHALLVA